MPEKRVTLEIDGKELDVMNGQTILLVLLSAVTSGSRNNEAHSANSCRCHDECRCFKKEQSLGLLRLNSMLKYPDISAGIRVMLSAIGAVTSSRKQQ